MSKNRNALALIGLGVPLVLINVMAVTGQALFAQANIHPSLWVAIPFAGAVESIAVFLAVMAHLVALAGDSALKLRLGAYGMGMVSGGMNFAHWNSDSGLIAGLGFGLLSSSSPWLWAIYTRYVARDRLRAAGLIEPRSVKFSAARWILWRKETWKALKVAVYSGITDPLEAVRKAADAYPESAPFDLPAGPEPVRTTPESDSGSPEYSALLSGPAGVGGRNGSFLALLDEEGGRVESAMTRLASETPWTIGKTVAYDLKRHHWAPKVGG